MRNHAEWDFDAPAPYPATAPRTADVEVAPYPAGAFRLPSPQAHAPHLRERCSASLISRSCSFSLDDPSERNHRAPQVMVRVAPLRGRR